MQTTFTVEAVLFDDVKAMRSVKKKNLSAQAPRATSRFSR
jgi:hypothetical protein